jgi:hypothetical protein
VVSAAPLPTGYFGGCTSEGCDDLPWMDGLAEAGAAECVDLVGAIHAVGATGPEESAGHPAAGGVFHHSWYFWPTVEVYSLVFDGERPLAFTTFGYLSFEGLSQPAPAFQWTAETTAADQAAWTARAVELSIASDEVGMLIISHLDYTGQTDLVSATAIIRPDGGCPTCDALQGLLGSY